MEVVRKYINASSLMSIMKLPENFKKSKIRDYCPANRRKGKRKRRDRHSKYSTVIGWSNSIYRYVID